MPITQPHQDLSQVDAIITGTRGVQKNTSTIKAIKMNWINFNLKKKKIVREAFSFYRHQIKWNTHSEVEPPLILTEPLKNEV